MAITIQQIARDARFNRRLKEANERHMRGDIDGELKSRMTKPKVAEPLYQVFVDIKGEDGSRAVSPRFAGDFGNQVCSQALAALNAKICLGKLPGWGNARIERIIPITAN